MPELADLTAATRLACFVMTSRPPKQPAKLWINHQLATRALLECPTTDPHHPTEPITLPEWIYLEFTLGQLTDEELRAFKLPGLGENLLEKKGDGGMRWTMGELQTSVNAVVHPPPVTRRETPITKLVYLLSNPLKPRERGDNWQPRQDSLPRPRPRWDKQSRGQESRTPGKGGGSKPRDGRDRRPPPNQDRRPPSRGTKLPHEDPRNFPSDLSRPVPGALNPDGSTMSSARQATLYDDCSASRCTRCHQPGHPRTSCTSKPEPWGKSFDSRGHAYWKSLASRQVAARAAKPPPPSPPAKTCTTASRSWKATSTPAN